MISIKKRCHKFKLLQTGPNWDKSGDGKILAIAIKRFEFYTEDHPSGLFTYFNSNHEDILKDPHYYQIKIDSNNHSTDNIHDINSNK